jgi:hypothetical protein
MTEMNVTAEHEVDVVPPVLAAQPAPAQPRSFAEELNATAPQHGTLEADKHFRNEHELDAKEPGHVFVRPCPTCGKLKQTSDHNGKTPCRRCQHEAKAKAAPNALVRLTAPEPIGTPESVPGPTSQGDGPITGH